ncbi:rRNA maturation RNase YbeY [Candidatus Gracilibacteria bacterium]|nr:rRNA maturation RNase YbeY [Candidatus Gracilibacteria bacterium]NUJ98587.1 rRNA maturation RNase YbeY [Candidatus Gracilibacteria bacterium]
MFGYTIINTPSFLYSKNTIDSIFKSISKNIDKKQNGLLNIVFVEQKSIKNLNNIYRKKNKETDVLSFHYFESFDTLKQDEIAGEIILCEEIIKKQGLEYGLGSEKEFYKLLIHSILHILGFDHEDENEYEIMKKIEEKIAQELDLF